MKTGSVLSMTGKKMGFIEQDKENPEFLPWTSLHHHPTTL
jgi:hypothetical protein